MIIEDIANKAPDCGGSGVLLGKDLGCEINMSNLRHGLFFVSGFRIPLGTDIDDDYITLQEQLGNLVLVNSAELIEFQPGDDSFITNSRGVETLDVPGLPKFVITVEESHEFYKQAAKLKSKGQYEFAYADEDNNLRLANYGSNGWGGFTTGHVTPGMVNPKVPGSAENMPITLQLTNRKQFDENGDIFAPEYTGIDFDSHQGVSPWLISFVAAPAAGNVAVIKITLADKKTAVTNAQAADLQLKVNDNVDTIVSLAPVVNQSGQYTLTTTTAGTAGQNIAVSSWDSTNLVVTINKGGKLYNGKEVTSVFQ